MRLLCRRHRISAALIALAASFLDIAAAQAQSYGTDQRYCDRGTLGQVLSTSRGNLVGSAAGAALGGLLGSKMGRGGGSTALTVLGVVGGALAGGYVGRSMDPADQACVGQTLEHTPTNQSVAWQNPNNGSGYWVTPTSSYQGPSGPCRNYVTQAVVNGQPQRVDGTACRASDGSWQPVSAGGAAPPPPPSAQGAVSRDLVFRVQQQLHDQGFYVRDNIDGSWGPKTMTAVRNFQQAKGLPATGQLDVQTLSALGLAGDSAQPSR